MPVAPATSAALRDYRDTVAAFGKLADYLTTRGTLLVAATGNESAHPTYALDVSPPAASEHVVSVGAIGASPGGFAVAPFSNTGGLVCAPGVEVVSARAGSQGIIAMSGTSMATPHVAGAAAVWLQWLRQDGLPATVSGVRARLEAAATLAGFAAPRPPLAMIGAGRVTVPAM